MNEKINGLNPEVQKEPLLAEAFGRIKSILSEAKGEMVGAARGEKLNGIFYVIVEGLFSEHLSRVATKDDVQALLSEEPELDELDPEGLLPISSKRINDNSFFSNDLLSKKLENGIMIGTTEFFIGKNKIAEMTCSLVSILNGVPSNEYVCKIFGKDVDLKTLNEFLSLVRSVAPDIQQEFFGEPITSAQLAVIERIADQLPRD